jgi:glycosyltransferase involved in cell wall biosynthesis
MRIAYLAPYQGAELLRRRPVVINLSLAANVKMELIAHLLQRGGHQVEIISQGEVVERRCRVYPSFRETVADSDLVAWYASAVPIKFVNAVWPALRTLQILRARHRANPFDLVLLYNLKLPQLVSALFAIQCLRLPVVLEYEDDALVDINGRREEGLLAGGYKRLVDALFCRVAGCVGVSPHLLAQVPSRVPTLLLRGVVSDQILTISGNANGARKNWVVYSGTHTKAKGIEQLVSAWQALEPPGWELHIAGHGSLTSSLESMAARTKTIVFHGLLDPTQNARLLATAKIAINPHDVSRTPGNVFAFKIVEYLAAGAHVITTPMGTLEPDLERGITYMPDNSAVTIAATLARVIDDGAFHHDAQAAAQRRYGSAAVATSLHRLLEQAESAKSLRRRPEMAERLGDLPSHSARRN